MAVDLVLQADHKRHGLALY